MYAWIVVFTLPTNSSLNPHLYTISDICSQERRSQQLQKQQQRMTHTNTKEDAANPLSIITTLPLESDQHSQPSKPYVISRRAGCIPCTSYRWSPFTSRRVLYTFRGRLGLRL